MAPRKRKANPAAWARNVKSRQANTHHQSLTDEEIVIHSHCGLKCSQRISPDRAQALCDELNGIQNKAAQDTFLLATLQLKVGGQRAEYTLRHESGARYRVCQSYWAAVYDIGSQRSRRLRNLLKRGQNIVQETRGMHSTRPNRLSEASMQAVKAHMNSFPSETTHYLRSRYPDRRYLSSDLTISQMHRLYMLMPDGIQHPICLSKYTELFHTGDFCFGVPSTDTCTVCDRERVHSLQPCTIPDCETCDEFKQHHSRVKATTDHRRDDAKRAKDNVSHVSIAMDLMKSLQLPKLSNEKMYYLRKLSAYVFGIHNYKDDSVVCYWWGEHVGGRGSDEVGSCLWNYLHSLPHQMESLSIWADRCAGQNANWYVVSMLFHFAALRNITIEYHLFETGHSFQACDSDFSLIERVLPQKMELPDDIEVAIREARPQRPFKPIQMTSALWLDLKATSNHLIKPTNDDIMFSDIRRFRFLANRHCSVSKSHIPTENHVDWKITRRTEEVLLPVMKYSMYRPIKAAKKRDLEKIIALELLSPNATRRTELFCTSLSLSFLAPSTLPFRVPVTRSRWRSRWRAWSSMTKTRRIWMIVPSQIAFPIWSSSNSKPFFTCVIQRRRRRDC
jgi:CRISPR/Cas system-associated endoribonuclease Cas2